MAKHNCECCVEPAAEELSPYKELVTTIVLQQDHGVAATSCYRQILIQKRLILLQTYRILLPRR